VEKPNDGSRLQATSRFPEYAEQPAANGAGAAGAGAAVVVFGRVVVVVGAGGAVDAGGVVAGGVVAAGVVGSALAVRASPRDARSSVRTAAGVGVD
jgi:hypothetical protein